MRWTGGGRQRARHMIHPSNPDSLEAHDSEAVLSNAQPLVSSEPEEPSGLDRVAVDAVTSVVPRTQSETGDRADRRPVERTIEGCVTQERPALSVAYWSMREDKERSARGQKTQEFWHRAREVFDSNVSNLISWGLTAFSGRHMRYISNPRKARRLVCTALEQPRHRTKWKDVWRGNPQAQGRTRVRRRRT